MFLRLVTLCWIRSQMQMKSWEKEEEKTELEERRPPRPLGGRSPLRWGFKLLSHRKRKSDSSKIRTYFSFVSFFLVVFGAKWHQNDVSDTSMYQWILINMQWVLKQCLIMSSHQVFRFAPKITVLENYWKKSHLDCFGAKIETFWLIFKQCGKIFEF